MTFPGYTPAALDFLKALKANNTRDWFQENKKVYEAEIKNPTKMFADEMAGQISKLTGDPQKPKIFRINRDIRFSKDKTPYNTHVHISWIPREAGGVVAPAMMFGLGTDYLTLGCGVFEFDKEALNRFREHVASDSGAQLEKLLAKLTKSGARLNEPALKKVPNVYPKDHPRGDLLRHKGIATWIDLDGPGEAVGGDLVKRCVAEFKKLKPVYATLKAI